MVMPTRGFDPYEQILEQLREMAGQMDRGFARVDRRLDRMDERFNTMDRRFDKIDERFNTMDRRFDKIDERFDKIDGRLDTLDTRLNVVDGKVTEIETEISGLRVTNMDLANKVRDASAQVQSLDGRVEQLTRTVAAIHAVVIPRADGSGRADEARDYLRRERDEGQAAAGVG
jgi:chromosome segregation ATPase